MKKKILYWFIVVILVVVASLTLASGKKNTVGICHNSGDKWVYMLVGENALNGHFSHGDFLYQGRPDVYDYEMDDWCFINANPQK